MDIQGQTAIVSGGASGMGAETARYLASAGAKVAIFDTHVEAATKVADEIGALAIVCDVSDAISVEQAIRQARKVNGPARIVVSCAGIAPAERIVSKQGPMPLGHFAQVINTNLVGTFNMMRVAAAEMISLEPLTDDSQERGIIINTASVAAFEGQIGQAAYSASKGGVVAMTLPAAREFAQFGIRVLAIAPGLIATPMLLNMPEAVQQGLAASVPFPKRLGRPDEFARLVIHLIENELMNGTVVRLDGGLRMREK